MTEELSTVCPTLTFWPWVDHFFLSLPLLFFMAQTSPGTGDCLEGRREEGQAWSLGGWTLVPPLGCVSAEVCQGLSLKAWGLAEVTSQPRESIAHFISGPE